jgi:hypothetical protein
LEKNTLKIVFLSAIIILGISTSLIIVTRPPDSSATASQPSDSVNGDANGRTNRESDVPPALNKITSLQNRTDGRTWIVGLIFDSPIISNKEHHSNFTLLITDSKTGEPAKHIPYQLIVSKLREKGGGSDPRLLAGGETKNDGLGQFDMAFDKVGWYLIELSPKFNETASFKVFSGGADFETDRQAYFPGQNVTVSGMTYPHDIVSVSLKAMIVTTAANSTASLNNANAPSTAIETDTPSVITDENGVFSNVRLTWPLNETGTVSDGLYTITVHSQALDTQNEKTVYFSHERPAIDIDVEPIPKVALAEKSGDSEECQTPSTRIFLKVKATYSDSGRSINNATVQLTGVYRMDEDDNNGGTAGEPVSSLTLSEYENKFTYSEKQKTWFGPGYGYPPQGLFFFTEKSPSVAGNYLFPGKYYFTVLVDDGRVKAVGKSEPFELTENVTRYLSMVGGSTGTISNTIKPGYNATFLGSSRYAGVAVETPYEKGTVQYLLPPAATEPEGMLNATGSLQLSWLGGANVGGYPNMEVLTMPFNVRIDPATRLIGCSIGLYKTGLFYPLAIQNATSLQPGESIAWAGAPYANATVIGDEKISVMNATIETVRIREDTLPYESFEPKGKYLRYDPNSFGSPSNKIGLVDAWFEKSTGHLVKLSAQQMRYFSEQVGYRHMQIETVMNSTNMPMEKTYDYYVVDTSPAATSDNNSSNGTGNSIIRTVFVKTNAIVDKFSYSVQGGNVSSIGDNGKQQSPGAILKFDVRPTLSNQLHYLFKIPKSIIGEQPEIVTLTRQQNDHTNNGIHEGEVVVPIIATDKAVVDVSSEDPYYMIIRLNMNGTDANAIAATTTSSKNMSSVVGIEIIRNAQVITTDDTSEKENGRIAYPLQELAFFSRTSDPEYYAQKLSDVLGLGRLQLIDHRSEYDGMCGYSPEDIHSYYKFLLAASEEAPRAHNNVDVNDDDNNHNNNNTTSIASTITVTMCANRVVGVSYDAFDISVPLSKNGANSNSSSGGSSNNNSSSSNIVLVPVSGVDDAPMVAKPLSDYRTYINKTKEITLRYLDELPLLGCFTFKGLCDNDGGELDTVYPAPTVHLEQELFLANNSSTLTAGDQNINDSSSSDASARASKNATITTATTNEPLHRGKYNVMEFIGNGVTASFDNTKGTLINYSVSRMYDTSSANKAIKYSAADARSMVKSYWNEELGISNVTVGGGATRDDGTVTATICDGRIYYHIDTYQEDRSGPVRFYLSENGVDAVTGKIVNDAQGFPITSQTCLPADKFDGFTISAKPDKQHYSKGEDVRITLEVTNPTNRTLSYERVLGGFVVLDGKTGKPVTGHALGFAGGSTGSDHVYRHGFIEFPARQTIVLKNPADNSSQPSDMSTIWENAQSGEYVVKVFILSPSRSITEFKITVN